MFTRKVKAVRPIGISTGLDKKKFNAGDVASLTFRDEKQYRNFLALGDIVEFNSNEIPQVVKPPITPRIMRQVAPSKVNEVKVPVNEVKTSTQGSITEILNSPVQDVIHKCKECNTILIPATDESQPGVIKHILYCPKCGKASEPAGVAQEKVQTSVAPKKEISLCPKCGRRKDKTRELCTKCLKSQA